MQHKKENINVDAILLELREEQVRVQRELFGIDEIVQFQDPDIDDIIEKITIEELTNKI